VSAPDLPTLVAAVLGHTEVLASIPAPTGDEAARAEVVRAWWGADGWGGVCIDGTGNVWARVRGGRGPASVLCAHLDTVFPASVPHEARRERGRLLGPGVADDAVAVAALSAVGSLISTRAGGPVWILATVGEEGLGNLAGIRGALAAPPAPIGCLLAIEGNYYGRVSTVGVGSVRRRVLVRGPGGHAWEAAATPSAVHAVAAIAAAVGDLVVDGARTSVNVGRIGGGEAVNARAREAWLELDVRADDPLALEALMHAVDGGLASNLPAGLDAEITELGRRPAGRIEREHPLVVAAVAALAGAGVTPAFVATSTDANAAHDAGIPAVAVGVTTGGGEHTPQEWIDIAPIADGLSVLASTVTRFEEARG
jgi:tripeptide aminopeptidase